MRTALRLAGNLLAAATLLAAGGLFVWACDVAGKASP
jgi:hypothetical protein